jgi:isocitrate dehydrogenase
MLRAIHHLRSKTTSQLARCVRASASASASVSRQVHLAAANTQRRALSSSSSSSSAIRSDTPLITVAPGDGIGPEITEATVAVLKAAEARIETENVTVGNEEFQKGNVSGISQHAWDSLRANRVLLKGPIMTPQGGGFKSVNVTMRKTLGLYANVRPCISFHPFVKSGFQNLDVVVIRENEEDLYAGIEHQQTSEVVQCLKLFSRPGIEKIVRYSFEYAMLHGRRKVTCMTKDNIMKQTDGMFHKVFDDISKEYPSIEAEHHIIDIGSALLATEPERFDVIVTTNLYGDIISDIVAQVSGSVGLAGSANIGTSCAMFEAIHGSAPDIAGRNVANPSGMINAAVMMLVHLGQPDIAERVQNALLCAIESGNHTADIFTEERSNKLVGTNAFAKQVISHLGQKPNYLPPADYSSREWRPISIPEYKRQVVEKQLVGVDVFLDWAGTDSNELGFKVQDALKGSNLKLKMITNRGIKVFPDGFPETFVTDHWRCRLVAADSHVDANKGQPAKSDQEAGAKPNTLSYVDVESTDVIQSLQVLGAAGLDCIKTENLYTFEGGVRGFSLGQGE